MLRRILNQNRQGSGSLTSSIFGFRDTWSRHASIVSQPAFQNNDSGHLCFSPGREFSPTLCSTLGYARVIKTELSELRANHLRDSIRDACNNRWMVPRNCPKEFIRFIGSFWSRHTSIVLQPDFQNNDSWYLCLLLVPLFARQHTCNGSRKFTIFAIPLLPKIKTVADPNEVT